MARQTFSLDASLFNQLDEKMREYQGNTENAINEVLWNDGGNLIDLSIRGILPRSGRTWSGKKAAAASTAPFTQENSNLAVTIKTKKAYQYLYFPDDGSNTRKHAGQQFFMFRGAEKEQQKIIDLCIGKLMEDF